MTVVASLVPPADPLAKAWDEFKIAFAAFLEGPTPAAADRARARHADFIAVYLADEAERERARAIFTARVDARLADNREPIAA